eukprot:13844754-Heterocapsa_arctica.AAC.1
MARTSTKTGITRRTFCTTCLADLSYCSQHCILTSQRLRHLNNVVDKDWGQFCTQLRSGPLGKAVPYWSVPREAW